MGGGCLRQVFYHDTSIKVFTQNKGLVLLFKARIGPESLKFTKNQGSYEFVVETMASFMPSHKVVLAVYHLLPIRRTDSLTSPCD